MTAPADSSPENIGPNIVELTGIRKVFRQVLAPQERHGMLARLFARAGGPPAERNGADNDMTKDMASGMTNDMASGMTNGMANGAGEGVEVLSDITLCIKRGEFVALQGTSGSGKSTLLHLLGLLDRPTSGTYRLLGRDVSGLDDDELSRLRNTALGFVFQSFYLVPYATALENVLLPGMYSGLPQAELRQRALELLDRVGLADRVHFKPANLSGGQQQRVAMARALLNQPELILADEPTGQLDSATSQEIMGLFSQVNQSGTSIVLVTHDEAVAQRAGRVIRLADGRITSDLLFTGSRSTGAAPPSA